MTFHSDCSPCNLMRRPLLPSSHGARLTLHAHHTVHLERAVPHGHRFLKGSQPPVRCLGGFSCCTVGKPAQSLSHCPCCQLPWSPLPAASQGSRQLLRGLRVPFSIPLLDWSCAAAALGCAGRSRALPPPSSSSGWDVPECSGSFRCLILSLQLSSCLLIQVWDGLEVSQKPGPHPSPGLVHSTRHFSASIQPAHGSWPFFGTKAQLHAPSPPASTAREFKKLPDSCLRGLLGQPWIPHQFPLARSVKPV